MRSKLVEISRGSRILHLRRHRRRSRHDRVRYRPSEGYFRLAVPRREQGDPQEQHERERVRDAAELQRFVALCVGVEPTGVPYHRRWGVGERRRMNDARGGRYIVFRRVERRRIATSRLRTYRR